MGPDRVPVGGTTDAIRPGGFPDGLGITEGGFSVPTVDATMPETWIDLQCPSCGETWEDSPADLPEPGRDFTCNHCGTERPMAEFMRTDRNREMWQAFHE